MIVFLREEDGSTSEHFYSSPMGFVREIILMNRSTGFEMRGRIFFNEDTMDFVDNNTWNEYEVIAMMPDGS